MGLYIAEIVKCTISIMTYHIILPISICTDRVNNDIQCYKACIRR